MKKILVNQGLSVSPKEKIAPKRAVMLAQFLPTRGFSADDSLHPRQPALAAHHSSAYRLIWNQICDALIYSTRRQANETTYDVTPYTAEQDDTDIELGIAIDQALDKAKLDAPPSTVKGIDAIRLMSEGYTCREIGEQIGATDKQVAAMVSKARKFLKSRKDVLDLAGNI